MCILVGSACTIATDAFCYTISYLIRHKDRIRYIKATGGIPTRDSLLQVAQVALVNSYVLLQWVVDHVCFARYNSRS